MDLISSGTLPGIIILAAVFVCVLLTVLGAGYRLRSQNAELAAYSQGLRAYLEVRRQLKLHQFIAIRQLRKELRRSVWDWASDKTPFENPSAERLKKEVSRINNLVRERPEILSTVLRAMLHETALVDELPAPLRRRVR